MNVLTHVIDARYIGQYTLWLRFNDRAEGEVDLSSQLYGEIFKPLQQTEYVRAFHLRPELRTVVWSNGADFALEFFRTELRVAVDTLPKRTRLRLSALRPR